ncbi:MAG: hypothetical protein K8R46_06740 [Pirellulales bacterium]|nr:hypothetical protein [Pirellulales bacterium]
MKKIILNLAVVGLALIAAFLLGLRLGESEVKWDANVGGPAGNVVLMKRTPVSPMMPSPFCEVAEHDLFENHSYDGSFVPDILIEGYAWNNCLRQKKALENFRKSIACCEQFILAAEKRLDAERRKRTSLVGGIWHSNNDTRTSLLEALEYNHHLSLIYWDNRDISPYYTIQSPIPNP